MLDCSDLDRSSAFWRDLLGFEVSTPSDGRWCALRSPGENPTDLLLQRVPERKTGKNRLHLDLQTTDLAAEVERAVALGASVVAPDLVEDGWRWHVLADPDGNEFCVIQPPEGVEA